MGEHGQVNSNSIALNKQTIGEKPNASAGGSASHEYKPPKAPEAKIPMPK